MSYIVDTVALIKYLQDDLPQKVDGIFRAAERGKHQLLLPHIVLGEFIYISLKGRLKSEDPEAAIREVLNLIETSRYLTAVDMDMAAWEEFIELEVSELHDRMICALAKAKNASVITPDSELSKAPIETIWD